MSANHIKIFNDTVLKQTILQGYESQRTNENLGEICMGELAFTRDTGRVFVGNFTTQDNKKDSSYVIGGSIVGNKYLGLLDSRPLGTTTSASPLSYEMDSENEKGLLLKDSRYRSEGGDGWDKTSTYIDKYGVYSGDYAFDLFNNALIIFDKKITTNKNKQVSISWENDQEVIRDNSGEDVTETSKIRTLIENGDEFHPIYGDGYAIMRILEPDGVTIQYLDKQFLEGEPKNPSNSPLSWKNWNHNILTVNYPANKIYNAFENSNFILESDGKITLNKKHMTLPHNVQFGEWDLSFNKPEEISKESILVVDKDGNVTTSKIDIDSIKTTAPEYVINLGEGLEANNGEKSIVLSENSSINLHLSKSNNKLTTKGYNPFNLSRGFNWVYSGTNAYHNGDIIAFNNFEEEYSNSDEFNTHVREKFDSDKNVGLNFLQKPIPLCWGKTKTNINLEFCVFPFVWCSQKSNEDLYTPSNTFPSQYSKSMYDQYGIYRIFKSDLIFPETSNIEEIRIPNHAQSVILEVHTTGDETTSISTARTFDELSFTEELTQLLNGNLTEVAPSFNSNSKILYSGNNAGCRTIEVPLNPNKLINWKNTNYSMEETIKQFSLNIDSNGSNIIIRLIGYRV